MRVLVVVARRYNGHELWTALKVFTENQVDFEVISTTTLIRDEVTNEPNTIERTLEQVEPLELQKFDGLMFVSGNMADTEAYWDDPRTLSYVSKAEELDLGIAAICCSVPTIREAARGKTVSFFPLIRSRERLTEVGANLSSLALSVDGKLCTAEHQMASQMWAENFVAVLKGEEPPWQLQDSGYTPKGRERKPVPEVEELKRKRAGVTGPTKCPDCNYSTYCIDGQIMCTKCDKDWTDANQA